MKNEILLLGGITASGKTEAAIALAQEFGAEIVGADSRQIYRDMPIGTAAPAQEQLGIVPHHMIAFVDPYERYSAARYVMDASRAIDDIFARGNRAIVVGGTGFYLRALAGAVDLAPQYDPSLRERLVFEARTHSTETLHGWLAARDPARAAAVHADDAYRVIRALEIALTSRNASDRENGIPTLRARNLDYRYAVLDVSMEEVDTRIERRVHEMLENGFVEEAERIGEDVPAASAVGYPLALAWARGWSTRPELRTGLVRATRRYARRQRTWFRGEAADWIAPGALASYAREKLHWT
jgi:tRNA dimethylallyltransferase